jgi:hypothetical protein
MVMDGGDDDDDVVDSDAWHALVTWHCVGCCLGGKVSARPALDSGYRRAAQANLDRS